MEKKSWIKRLEEKFPDYDLTHVPEEKRQPWHAFTVLFMAWTCILAPTLVGATIALGLGFRDGIVAIVLGCVITSIVSVSVGLIGKRMGLGTGMLTRYAFGIKGAILPAFLLGFMMFVWHSLDQWQTGTITMGLIGDTWGWFVGPVILIGICVVAVITGIRGPAWIAYFTVPVMVIMYIGVIAICVIKGGGWAKIAAWEPVKPASLVFGIYLSISSWINGGVMSSDFMRMSKSNLGVFLGPPAGLIITNGMNLIVGFIGFIALNAFGLAEIGLALVGGASAVVIICSFFMLVNSNPETNYSSSLAFASIFNVQKHRISIFVGIGAIVLAAMIQWISGGLPFVLNYLPLVAATMTPIAGVLLADYWIVNKGHWPDVSRVTCNVSWVAVFAWLVGAVLNYWTGMMAEANPTAGIKYGVPGLNGLVVSFVFHWALMAILKVRVFVSTSPTFAKANER